MSILERKFKLDFHECNKAGILPSHLNVINAGLDFNEGMGRYSFTGSGIATGIELSQKSAQYELFERYYSSYKNCSKIKFLKASVEDLRRSSIRFSIPNITVFHTMDMLFHKSNIKFDKSIFWMKYQFFNDPNTIFFPAHLSFWDFPQNTYYISNSTGFAYHNNLFDAIRYSYFELLERHLISLSWYNQDFLKFVIYNHLEIANKFKHENPILYRELTESSCDKIVFVDLINSTNFSSNGYAFLCFCFFNWQDNIYFSTGASFHNDQATSIQKALREAYKNIPFFITNHQLGNFNNLRGLNSFDKVPRLKSFSSHFFLYNYSGELRNKSRLFRDIKKEDYSEFIKSSNSGIKIPSDLCYTILKHPDGHDPNFVVRSWKDGLNALSPDSGRVLFAKENIFQNSEIPSFIPHFFP